MEKEDRQTEGQIDRKTEPMRDSVQSLGRAQECMGFEVHLSSGSHDTMTYCLSRKSPISRSESRLLHLLGRVAPCIMGPMVLRWSVTQVSGA